MDLPDLTERRDRVLAALITADPSLAMLRWDAEAAILLATREAAAIYVLTAPYDLPEDRLEYIFTAHLKSVSQGAPPTHFVVVGGGPGAAEALRKVAPRVQSVPMGFHAVHDDGRIEHLTGEPLPLLTRAAPHLFGEEPVDPEPLAAAVARGQKLMVQQQAVAAKLGGRTTVTAALTAACVVLAVLGRIWSEDLRGEALWRLGANSRDAVVAGEYYRLLASAFLHGNVMHFAVNMMALWSLGPALEAILGPRRYLVLYGASALGGSLASAFLRQHHSSVGASGAIWGLMAAGIALAVWPKGVIPKAMADGMRSRAFSMLALNVVISMMPGIDMSAHLGGGAVGFVLMATVLTSGLVPIDRRASAADFEARKSPLLDGTAFVMAVAMAASVVWGIAAGKPWEIGGPPKLARTAIADTGVSIEIPSYAARKPSVSKANGHTVVSFGSFQDSPVVFEVVIAPRPEEVPAEQLDAYMEQARKELADASPPKWIPRGEAKRVNLGKRPALMMEHDFGKARVRTYYQTIGANEVFVRSYGAPERPMAWAGIEERVAASVLVR